MKKDQPTAEITEAASRRDVPIAQALRMLRVQEGVTQTEMARRGGPDFRTISHWETGRKMPSLPLLFQYLDALALDLHDLQAVFDQIAQRHKMMSRLTAIERRLGALERSLVNALTSSEG